MSFSAVQPPSTQKDLHIHHFCQLWLLPGNLTCSPQQTCLASISTISWPKKLRLYRLQHGLWGLVRILSMECAGMLCCWHCVGLWPPRSWGDPFFLEMVVLYGSSCTFVLRCIILVLEHAVKGLSDLTCSYPKVPVSAHTHNLQFARFHSSMIL